MSSILALGQITYVDGELMGVSLPVDFAKLAYSRSGFQTVPDFS